MWINYLVNMWRHKRNWKHFLISCSLFNNRRTSMHFKLVLTFSRYLKSEYIFVEISKKAFLKDVINFIVNHHFGQTESSQKSHQDFSFQIQISLPIWQMVDFFISSLDLWLEMNQFPQVVTINIFWIWGPHLYFCHRDQDLQVCIKALWFCLCWKIFCIFIWHFG